MDSGDGRRATKSEERERLQVWWRNDFTISPFHHFNPNNRSRCTRVCSQPTLTPSHVSHCLRRLARAKKMSVPHSLAIQVALVTIRCNEVRESVGQGRVACVCRRLAFFSEAEVRTGRLEQRKQLFAQHSELPRVWEGDGGGCRWQPGTNAVVQRGDERGAGASNERGSTARNECGSAASNECGAAARNEANAVLQQIANA